MEITTEILKTIYNRATQYAIAKYGSEPDRIELDSDGTITARWTGRDAYDDDELETITAFTLTEDLDKVATERMEREEIQRKQREYERIKEQNERNRREEEARKQMYLKLKKEFEK